MWRWEQALSRPSECFFPLDYNQSWQGLVIRRQNHNQSWHKKGMLQEENNHSWPRLVMQRWELALTRPSECYFLLDYDQSWPELVMPRLDHNQSWRKLVMLRRDHNHSWPKKVIRQSKLHRPSFKVINISKKGRRLCSKG